jgi:hypothetical protein
MTGCERALVPHALERCRVRPAPAARVRGGSNPARWAFMHSALPLHREKSEADFGFLPLALETACVLALAASRPARAVDEMLLS